MTASAACSPSSQLRLNSSPFQRLDYWHRIKSGGITAEYLTGADTRRDSMKEHVNGVVQKISTNPFQTFTKKKSGNSTVFSFDITFDLVDEEGASRHVWFKRSFRFPPKLEDGDSIEVIGRQGYLLGVFGRRNFYALRIIDMERKREYTPWRNLVTNVRREKSGGESKSRTPDQNTA